MALQERLHKLLAQGDELDFSVLGLDTRMIETVSKLQSETTQQTVQEGEDNGSN